MKQICCGTGFKMSAKAMKKRFLLGKMMHVVTLARVMVAHAPHMCHQARSCLSHVLLSCSNGLVCLATLWKKPCMTHCLPGDVRFDLWGRLSCKQLRVDGTLNKADADKSLARKYSSEE